MAYNLAELDFSALGGKRGGKLSLLTMRGIKDRLRGIGRAGPKNGSGNTLLRKA